MTSFNDVWNLVCDYCLNNKLITDVGFNTWFDTVKPIKLVNNHAILSVKDDFKKNIIDENYMTIIETAFAAILGFKVQVEFRSREAINVDNNPYITDNSKEFQKSLSTAGYDLTFENFIVGPSNRFANAAALAVAASPIGNEYSPLFIYGQSGLGKTHLLSAIFHQIQEDTPDFNIIYTKCETFTNEYIKALQNGTIQKVQDYYRSADVLLLDDVQFLSKKKETQEALFHIFETLHDKGKLIVFTSDRPPKEISVLDERLRGRFEEGMMADIGVPEYETRVAIMKRKAELLNFNIPDDVVNFISERLKSNIRQLEGIIKRLKAYYILEGKKPTRQLAQLAIQDMILDTTNNTTPEKIITEVARNTGVTVEDIRSKKRGAKISYARLMTAYIMREILKDMTLEEIGKEVNRDYSTVVYYIQQVEENMMTDSYYKSTVNDIISFIRDEK